MNLKPAVSHAPAAAGFDAPARVVTSGLLLAVSGALVATEVVGEVAVVAGVEERATVLLGAVVVHEREREDVDEAFGACVVVAVATRWVVVLVDEGDDAVV